MSTSKRIGWRFGVRSVCSLAALLAGSVAPLAAQNSSPPVATVAASAPVESSDTDPVFHVVSPETKVNIIQLQARTLEFSKKIEVVDGFDPGILTVTPVSPTQIRLRAESTGVTSMTIKDETGAIFKVEVFAEGDVRELRAYLQRLFPGSTIEVISLRESVILRGWVTDPMSIPQIMAVAKQMYPTVHNQLQVGGVNVVQLHVKILEVQRSKLKQLGFNFVAQGQNYAVASSIGGLAPVTSLGGVIGAPPNPAVGTSTVPMKFAITGNSDMFQGFIDALTTEALAKVLAEPTLVTTSGRPASLLSGGEFPILVPGAVGTVSIQFREFGVRMEAVPTVLGNGRLRLDIAPEVSERDFSSAVNLGGLVVPGMNTRRVNTQVEMNFGETIMVGGLISRKRVTQSSKYPILGEIPVIGAAFSRKSHEIGETELLIMVTPEMAGAMRSDQVPHDAPGWLQDEPTSKELFLDGMLEVPSYGPDCADCGNGMNGGMAYGGAPYGNGGPGMGYGTSANCSPPPLENSEVTSPLAPEIPEASTTTPPVGEIQTMSGQAEEGPVVQAGGDPFRVPTRREIPDSSARKPKAKSISQSSSKDSSKATLPGPIGPKRPSPSRTTGQSRGKRSDSESSRELTP